MFQTPAATPVPAYTSRRSTRASRSTTTASKLDSQGDPLTGPHSGAQGRGRGHSHSQSTSRRRKTQKKQPSPIVRVRNIQLNSHNGPARKWAQVLRPPSAGVGFQTMKWVKVEELTFEEKLVWDEEQQRKKDSGVVLTDAGSDGKKDGTDAGAENSATASAEASESGETETTAKTDQLDRFSTTSASASASASASPIMGIGTDTSVKTSINESQPSLDGSVPVIKDTKDCSANDATSSSTNSSASLDDRSSKKRKLEDVSDPSVSDSNNENSRSRTTPTNDAQDVEQGQH